jgi:hypothetical protein
METSAYHIMIIKGSLDLLNQGLSVAQELVAAWDADRGVFYDGFQFRYKEALNRLTNSAKNSAGKLDLKLVFTEDYIGPFGEMLNEINSRLPDLEILVATKRKHDDAANIVTHYSPSGSVELGADGKWNSEPLPYYGWIPQEWFEMLLTLHSCAKGDISMLGHWGTSEKEALKQALLSGELANALGFGPKRS